MKVSIITANYNCGKFLGDCIRSVQTQEYPLIEHIILDDCSNDQSTKILKKFEAKYPHINILFSDTRLYCGSAYSRLSQAATGDIVCVLDADDILVKNAVSKIVELYKTYPAVSYIWTQFWFCDANLKKIRKGISAHPGKTSLLEAGLQGKHCFSHWRTFRRNVLEHGEIFQDGLKSAVDKFMGYSLEELGIGGFTSETLYKYRQRIGGLSFTGRKNWEKMKKAFAEKRLSQNITPYPIKKLCL